MRMPANLKTLALPLFVWLAFFAVDAHAAIDNAGVFDSVLDRYQAAASRRTKLSTPRAAGPVSSPRPQPGSSGRWL